MFPISLPQQTLKMNQEKTSKLLYQDQVRMLLKHNLIVINLKKHTKVKLHSLKTMRKLRRKNLNKKQRSKMISNFYKINLKT